MPIVPPLLVQVEIPFSQDTWEAGLITPISSYTHTYSVHVIQWYSFLRLKFTTHPLVLIHINPTYITLTWPSSFILMPHSSHMSTYVCVRTVLPLPPSLSHYVHNTNSDVTINLTRCADTLPQLGPAASLSLSLSASLSFCLCLSLCVSHPVDYKLVKGRLLVWGLASCLTCVVMLNWLL